MIISKSKLASAAKNMFQSLGLEIAYSGRAPTERNALASLFRDRRFHFILDVGANTGQYAMLARRCGHRGPIVSFEPLSAAHTKLAESAAADAQWMVADRAALGARAARTTINVAGNSASSSLLPMTLQHVAAAPQSAFIGQEPIDVIALDDCIERYVGAGRGGLLKIDAQGYEMEILRGADRTLACRLDAVQTELSLTELYAGQPLLLDVCNFLKKYDFTLRYIIPGFKDPRSGTLLQLDGIFIKTAANA